MVVKTDMVDPILAGIGECTHFRFPNLVVGLDFGVGEFTHFRFPNLVVGLDFGIGFLI